MTAAEVCNMLDGPHGVCIGLTSGEESSPHAPDYLVKPAYWGGALDEGLVLEELAIVDFGEAFLEGQPAKFSGIPRHYGAPEILYNQSPSAASDVWALGASIMEVFGGEFFAEEVLPATMLLEGYLGPLPLEYRDIFEKQHHDYLRSRREYEDLSERNLLRQGLSEYVDKSPKTEPSKWVLTEAQRTDPSHPVSLPSVAALESVDEQNLLEAGYSHPFSLILSYLNFGYFKGPNPRQDEYGNWYLTRDEVLRLTDLALKIFRYDCQERPTPAQILQHPCLKEKGVVPEEGRDVGKGEYATEGEDEGVMGMGLLQRAINALWPTPWWYFQTHFI